MEKTMRKLIAKCKECDNVNYMACYDNQEEMLGVVKDMIRFTKEGIKYDLIDHQSTDKQPNWCECNG